MDQLAVAELGFPSIVLMENAAGNAAVAVLDLLRQRKLTPGKARVAVVCGGGNNGGDGYAIARHLHNAGCQVTLHPAKEPGSLTGDALTNATIAERIGIAMQPVTRASELVKGTGNWAVAHVIVDALLGTGFTGSVRPPLDDLIQRINEARRWEASIVAVDIPSGLDCDTGLPGAANGPVVEADLTVTFVAEKVGFANAAARRFLGRVVVAGIGTPPSLTERVLREA